MDGVSQLEETNRLLVEIRNQLTKIIFLLAMLVGLVSGAVILG